MNIEQIGQKSVEAYLQKTQSSGEKAASPTARETSRPEKDEAVISQAARRLQEAQDAVRNAPDVRDDKVAAIKKQIEDGSYRVDTEALVDKLLSVFGKK